MRVWGVHGLGHAHAKNTLTATPATISRIAPTPAATTRASTLSPATPSSTTRSRVSSPSKRVVRVACSVGMSAASSRRRESKSRHADSLDEIEAACALLGSTPNPFSTSYRSMLAVLIVLCPPAHLRLVEPLDPVLDHPADGGAALERQRLQLLVHLDAHVNAQAHR